MIETLLGHLPTTSFIVFLGIGFIFAWELKPKYQAMIYFWSILIPLAMLVATAYFLSGGSAYRAGQITAQCTISTLATMIAMVIIFYAKPEKRKYQDKSKSK